MVTDTSYQNCVVRKDGENGTSPWLLHVNGHRYSERELNASGTLVYKESMVSEPFEIPACLMSKLGGLATGLVIIWV